MDYYQFHIGDWKGATDHLTIEEEGIYLRLINFYYDTEHPLPINVDLIARRIRLPELAPKVESILKEFFELLPDGWTHGRCDGVIEKFQLKSAQASKASRSRRTIRKKERTISERSTDDEPTNNHKPITSSVPDKQERTDKSKKRFVPPTPEEVVDYFQEKKFNGDPAHFMDHFENCDWKLSNGRGAKMKNWRLAANNWSRNEAIFNPKTGGVKNGKLVLPKNRDGWQQFAEIHSLPLARSGESYDAWQGRMQSEIEKRSNH